MNYLISVLFLVLLAGCSKNPAQLQGKERLDYVFKHIEYLGGLKEGMTKDQIRVSIGSPENIDNDYVWMYADVPSEDEGKQDWENIRQHGSSYGFFLTFYQDKLTSRPTKIAEDDPRDTLAHTAHLPSDQANKLLNDARARHQPPASTGH